MIKATVASIILHPDGSGRFLLARRGTPPFAGYWSLAGGHIDLYERSIDAARREVREELGIDFEARPFRTFDEIIEDQRIHAVVQVFAGPAATDEPRIDGVEITEARWATWPEARELDLAFHHKDILRAYFG